MTTHMNPGHPACELIRNNWEPLLGFLVFKLGKEVHLTVEEMDEIGEFLRENALAIDVQGDAISFRFLPLDKARELAVEHGGLPN